MVFEHQEEKKMFYDNLFACSQRLDYLQDLQRQQIEMGKILFGKYER